MGLVIASHNLMDGRRLPGLLGHHRATQRDSGLDVLCIQENRRPDGSACAPRIAAALGPSFDHVGDHPRTRLAIVFDRQKLELASHSVDALPRLTRLTRFERLFIGSGTPQQKYVQLAVFRQRRGEGGEAVGPALAVANFHLDTAGGNSHRTDQIAAIGALIERRGLGEHLVACGDTNAFSVRRAAQLATLARVLEPISRHGATDPGRAPTHFFARQREPKMTHRLAVVLGRVGFDVPGRYDVVCSNVPSQRRGQRSTPDSDHDLVWADLALTA